MQLRHSFFSLYKFFSFFRPLAIGFLIDSSAPDSTVAAMISDSIPKASIPMASSNPKDLAKKKRVISILVCRFLVSANSFCIFVLEDNCVGVIE